jgi:pimeloyl-ACP methyl ester carboxylesterase
MVLLHGLWSTAALWRPFMGYLAHRGWHCVALQLRDATSLPTLAADVRAAIATLAAPPVVIGHDLGGLLALQLTAASAVVTLAPLLLPPFAAHPPSNLAQAGTVLDRCLARPRRAPGGRWRAAYPARAHPRRESPALIADLRRTRIELPANDAPLPRLVVTGEGDPVTDVSTARTLVERLGAELTVEATASHALPIDPGWEHRVSDIHRWLVRTLGRPLLALYDEAMEERD